jgi:hypothetical protein
MSGKLALPEESDLIDDTVPDSAHDNIAPEAEEGGSTIETPRHRSRRCFRFTHSVSRFSSRVHQRIPYLRRVPGFVIFPILSLIIVNLTAWAIVGGVLRYHPYNSVLMY